MKSKYASVEAAFASSTGFDQLADISVSFQAKFGTDASFPLLVK